MNDDPRQKAVAKARSISLLALDVDGVMTDGRLYFSNGGDEFKAFHIMDGLGVKLLRDGGIDTAIITGRRSDLVARRAAELGIRWVYQGREDKGVALDELRRNRELDFSQIAYMGDDLQDLPALRLAGLGITVANGHATVARYADWQTSLRGGEGAVREACEFILEAQGKLAAILDRYLTLDRADTANR